MRLQASLVCAFLITLVNARVIQLFALSVGDPNIIPFLGLSYKHVGAALDYIYLGFHGVDLHYDEAKGIIFDPRAITGGPLGPYTTNFNLGVTESDGSFFPYLQLAPAVRTKWTLGAGNKLRLAEGEGKFYVAKNTGEPYDWSKNEFVVGFTDADIDSLQGTGSDITEVEIIAHFPDEGPPATAN